LITEEHPMSRIENILAKANKLKEGQVGQRAVNNNAPAPAPAVKLPQDVFSVETALHVENPCLVTITDPGCPISEEYKKLKSMVMKLTNSGRLLNTIMVTSTVAGEGKSITALNLAVTLAQEYDHTVLLVDTDLRKPSATNYLGIQSRLGLSDCLTRDIDAGEALVKTGIGKLVVLPAGKSVDNPVELLSSGKMQTFVKELKNRYQDRYVIFDTPPVLSFAEAHSLGSIVDGVIFVVREGTASMPNIKEALNLLKNANILGIVYNSVEINRFDSHYRYGAYNNRYKYGTK
jgi:receptor protein-tyrosine kinase/non-specific protein-tyrosine kinase